MKFTQKLLIALFGVSLLAACGPSGPSKEQLAAEQQAEATYNSAKADYDSYNAWKNKAVKAASSVSKLGLKMAGGNFDSVEQVKESYEAVTKELTEVVDELEGMKFNHSSMEAVKAKALEGFGEMRNLAKESIPYITKNVPANVEKDMVERRKKAVKAVNNELGVLEKEAIKELNEISKKYHEIKKANDELRK